MAAPVLQAACLEAGGVDPAILMDAPRLPAAMRTPRLPLLVPVILVLLAALAGCTSQETTSEELSPISAREALEEARPTVEAWDEEAQLLVMSGFEGGEESPAVQRQQQEEDNDVDDGFPVHEDSLPGDGRAPQWVMVFLGGNQTRTVQASSEEVSWLDEGGQQAGPGARPLGNWSIDSPEAVQRALDESDDLDQLVAASDVSLFLTLSQHRQGGMWQLQATSHSVGQQTVLFVDADTGEVQNRSQMQTSQRTERFTGTLADADDEANHTVEFDEPGARLAVELTWNASADEGGPRLSAALSANGTELEPADAEQRAERFQARWDGLEPGEHEIGVTIDETSGEPVDYELAVHVAE